MPGNAPEHYLFYGLTESQKAEARRLIDLWEAGSFGSVEDSVAYHHAKHGGGSLLDYLHRAASFSRRGARRTLMSSDRVRYIRADGEYLIVNPNTNAIISYGRNT